VCTRSWCDKGGPVRVGDYVFLLWIKKRKSEVNADKNYVRGHVLSSEYRTKSQYKD
jgi:hypothetical protein